MTPEELDREVCEFLGIPPIPLMFPPADYIVQMDPVWPAVSTTWEGLGLVLEAMRKSGRYWVIEEAGTQYRVSFIEGFDAVNESLPMALALAVQQLAKERG